MGKKQNYVISDGLITVKKGMLLLALAEYFNLQHDDIVGITNSKKPEIAFTKKGMDKILSKGDDAIFPNKNTTNRSIKIADIDEVLRALSSQAIFKKFPMFFLIADEKKYADLNQTIGDIELIERCDSMQMMWKQWGNVGLPHLISSHQALQRLLATKMSKPLANEFNDKHIKNNGLSIEYQCEIYGNQLYGAKLLDIWHEYLLNTDSATKNPNDFLQWVSGLCPKKLSEFDINLSEIPKVNYMVSPTQREPWLLHFKKGNIVEGKNVPKGNTPGEELEIIYALGNSEGDTIDFFGGPKKRGTINHSSFFGGGQVDGAGRIILRSKMNGSTGSIEWFFHSMDNNSGHIKPDDHMTLKILTRLETLGLDLTAILWVSKWGSVGQRGETAALALQRLRGSVNQSDLRVVNSIDSLDTTSNRLGKIAEFANNGAIQKLHQYLIMRSFKITVNEAAHTALLIKDALHKHADQLPSAPLTQQKTLKQLEELGDLAVGLLKNIGIRAPAFEAEVANIIDMCRKKSCLQPSQSSDSFFATKAPDMKKEEAGSDLQSNATP
ncbi:MULTISPECIES: hypothetical protein [Legionella]|uniref:hypothetical protein n=1 Tax=Legionella TaxID=445 RepID=UPI00095B4E2C|nr:MULTISPECIES: hypothetical protein [Legionella]MBN9226710.1 hypothetical protein [Legionella steelei]OJW06735.1 MAG: hypothetical protein BGO44_18275 [Legionella sp. 39-23]